MTSVLCTVTVSVTRHRALRCRRQTNSRSTTPLSPLASGRPTGGQSPPTGAYVLGVEDGQHQAHRGLFFRAAFPAHIFISFLKKGFGLEPEHLDCSCKHASNLAHTPMLWLPVYCPGLYSPICPRTAGFKLEGPWQSCGPDCLRNR